MMILARSAGACFLIAAMTLMGCKSGNPDYPVKVSGKVTHNGTTVGGGTITFHTADGAPIQAPIAPDGTYAFASLPEGTFGVTIETESINPSKKKEEYKGAVGGGPQGMYGKSSGKASPQKSKGAENSPAPDGAQVAESIYVKIPAKYNDKATSGLTVTLKKGEQKHNFELTD